MAPPPLPQRPPQWQSWPNANLEQSRPPPPWQANRQPDQRHMQEMASGPPLPFSSPLLPDSPPSTLAVLHIRNAATALQNECISLLAHHAFGIAPPEAFRQALTSARERLQQALAANIPDTLLYPQTSFFPSSRPRASLPPFWHDGCS